MDVTVAVCTYGAKKWIDLAEKRAIPSAFSQGVPVVHAHGKTLADARNNAVAGVETEWICHLDADDELEAGYFKAMSKAFGDLRAPAVRYVWDGFVPELPALPPHPFDRQDLTDGNWLVIGTLVRTDLVCRVGGWREWPLYEDWDLWQRCWLTGAVIEAVPNAVYRAHGSYESRNRKPGRSEKLAAHHAIRKANFPHLYEDVDA